MLATAVLVLGIVGQVVGPMPQALPTPYRDGRAIQGFVDRTLASGERVTDGRSALVDELLGRPGVHSRVAKQLTPVTPTSVIDEWSWQFRQARGTRVVHVVGPIHLGTDGDYLGGTWPSKSIIVVWPPPGQEVGLSAVHVSAAGVGIENVEFQIQGEWEYLFSVSRHEATRGAHGLNVRNCRFRGKGRRAAFGDFAAEVYALRDCDFWNEAPEHLAVFETVAIVDGQVWSNSTKWIENCTFQTHVARARCVLMIGSGTHDVRFSGCNVAVSGDLDAFIVLGTRGLPNDPSTRAYNVIGHFEYSGGHEETFRCQAVVLVEENVALRNCKIADGRAIYCGPEEIVSDGSPSQQIQKDNWFSHHMPWMNTRL